MYGRANAIKHEMHIKKKIFISLPIEEMWS